MVTGGQCSGAQVLVWWSSSSRLKTERSGNSAEDAIIGLGEFFGPSLRQQGATEAMARGASAWICATRPGERACVRPAFHVA